MEPFETLRWQAWNDDGGTIVCVDDRTVTLELICEASQRRWLTLCKLADYFTEIGSPGNEPIRNHVARDLDAASAEAVAAAVRERLRSDVGRS